MRPPSPQLVGSPHYRMPMLERAGGHLVLSRYSGDPIPRSEWEELTYTTYDSDPTTFFAPITSATGEVELSGFWRHGVIPESGASRNQVSGPADRRPSLAAAPARY